MKRAVGVLRRAWDAISSEARQVHFKWWPTCVVAYATFALLLPEYHKGKWLFAFYGWLGGDDVVRFCRMAQLSFRFLLEVPLPMALILVSGKKLSEHGLGLGKFRTGMKMTVLFYLLYVPCFVVLFMNSGFQQYYSGITQHIHSWPEFVNKEIVSTSVLCLRTEFLFRGFLLFGVARSCGPYAGVLVQIIPYVLAHAGKAPMEAFGSFPVGMALAYLALKTDSIWYGAFLHGTIAILFNALILYLHFAGH